MKLPIQARPVKRPEIIEPYKTVDVTNAAPPGNKYSLLNIRIDLLHGANYNAPMRVIVPVDFCGCHLFSGSSMAQCLAACGLL